MSNYYNEFDPVAAAWLRELIKAGHLPEGDVDERSIEDVVPGDLAGYTQCHFFAGIGGWSLALALAGWPVDRPVWTGSCPCQPFSAAGKGAGFDDQRHLWPAWFHLIRECRPAAIFGEQVASAAVGPWLDLVQADLEGVVYAFGSVAFPAAGIGAPHIRDRTYWVGYANDARSQGHARNGGAARGQGPERSASASGVPVWLGNADRVGAWRDGGAVSGPFAGQDGQHLSQHAGAPGAAGGLADADSWQRNGITDGQGRQPDGAQAGWVEGNRVAAAGSELLRPGPVNGHWRIADWLGCRDGKWRPVEPGTQPLVDGLPRSMVRLSDPCTPLHPAEARGMRLRGYGNAIVPDQAAIFIQASGEAIYALQGPREEAAEAA